MNRKYRNKQTIRFRRWSRKAYSMFCSLGKCVTIGHLKKGIADASLGKQANVDVSYSVCPFMEKEAGRETDDEADDGLEWFGIDLLQRVPAQSYAKTADSATVVSILLISNRAERVCNASFRLFFYISV